MDDDDDVYGEEVYTYRFDSSRSNNNSYVNPNAGSVESLVSSTNDSNRSISFGNLPYPRSFVREQVHSQVKECLWLKEMKEEYNQLLADVKLLKESAQKFERCAICTLPYGSCQHTRKRVGGVLSETMRRRQLSEVEQEIEDVFSVMGEGVIVESKPDVESVDINALCWRNVEIRLSDRIGITKVSVSTPKPRGWHTVTNLGDKFLVMFGGISFRKGAVPQPFASVIKQENVDYLNQLLLYDLVNMSWHSSQTNKASVAPCPRYGHVAAAIDEYRMLVFGGRSSNGGYLSDSWIYDLTKDNWEPLRLGIEMGAIVNSSPSGRVFSSMIKQGDDLFMFGGTDGSQNFCDIWVFRCLQLRWERVIAVGSPASPRYGHRLVRIDKYRIAVLGGCGVCPFSEVSGGGVPGGLMGMTIQETKALFDLGSAVEHDYCAEGHASIMGGELLSHDLAQSDMKSLLKSASTVAARVSDLEYDTRATEIELLKSWQLSQAGMAINSRKARHPDSLLDIIFLDTRDLVWKPPLKIKVNKDNPDHPVSRMHFAATSVGGYIIVVGGIQPTCLKHSIVDQDIGAEGVRLHVMDPHTQRWTLSRPKESAQYLDGPLSIAEADLIRARDRVLAEKSRGLSLGALNGKTIELAEAEAVLQVCEWRMKMLLDEKKQTRPAPPACWGTNGFELVRQRAFMLGGWKDSGGITMGDGPLLLDIETEAERVRRQADEFSAKLNREREEEESKARLNNFLSAAELRAQREREAKMEEHERRIMSIEEILSALPPLSKPTQVRLVKANEHTIWVEWDRVGIKANGDSIAEEHVTYFLYCKTDFQPIIKGDRVLVAPLAATLQAENQTRELSGGGTGTSTEIKLFPGELLDNGKHGFFSVYFDDGTIERRVHRKRIKLDPHYHKHAPLSKELKSSIIRPGKSVAVRRRLASMAKAKERRKEFLARYNPAFAPAKVEDPAAEKRRRRLERQEAHRQHHHHHHYDHHHAEGHHHHHHVHHDLQHKGTNGKLVDEYGLELDPSEVPAAEAAVESSEESSSSSSSDDEVAESNEVVATAYVSAKSIIATVKSDRLTCTPGPEWRLVYVGNENTYACTNVVSDEVLLLEPFYTAKVSFCLQTHGLEFPEFEHSQLSDPVDFHTVRLDWNEDGEYCHQKQTTDHLFFPEEDDESSVVSTNTGVSSITAPVSPTSESRAENNRKLHDLRIFSPTSLTVTYPTIGMIVGPIISKNTNTRKKEMIPAVVHDHHFHMEKQYHHVMSTGTFDHFM